MADLSNPGTIPIYARSFGSWEITLRRHPLNRAEIVRDYDAASTGWHRSIERLGVTTAYSNLWHDVLARLDRTGDVRALDCGTGTGAFAEALAEQADTKLTAIDLSPEMVETAKARLRRFDAAVKLGSVTSIPAPAGAFDITSAAHVLEHLPDPETGLAEMARVTRPGGLVVACITTNSLAGQLIALRWRTHRFSTGAVERIFRNVGLHPLNIRPLGQGLLGPLSLAIVARKPI